MGSFEDSFKGSSFRGSEQKQRSCALGLGVLEAWVQGLRRFRVLGFRLRVPVLRVQGFRFGSRI